MRVVLLLIVLFVSVVGVAQPFGNEWINYDQRYYRFAVAEEGIYRINYNALAAAGVPLGTIQPQSIQIYNREQQVPIYVKGEDDGVFGLTDYIELYATGNDGWLDELVYQNSSDQVNPYYSLYNDTIFYYLTWEEGSTNNLRYTPVDEQNLSGLTPMPYIWKKSVLSLTTNYFQGELDSWGTSTSFFTAGEGWFGPRIGLPPSGVPVRNFLVPSAKAYTGPNAPMASFRAVVASNSDADAGIGNPNHHLQIGYGSANNPTIVYDETFSGYQVIKHNFEVPTSVLGNPETLVQFRVVDDLNVAADYSAVSNISLKYAMQPDLSGQNEWSLEIATEEISDIGLFRFSGYATAPVVYVRGNNPQRITAQPIGDEWQVGITPGSEPVVPIYISVPGSEKIISTVEPVGAAGNGFFTNYQLINVDSAYVIVTHRKLLEGAQQYQVHRNLRFNTLLAEVDELYDQFGGGIEKSGMAIRRFIDMLLGTWNTPPQYLFLIGKSIREAPEGGQAGSRTNASFFARNLVPSFGYPPSDNLITVGLQGSDGLQPTMRTGRLAAETNQQVFDYLNKVVTFENQPPAEWMKRVMHFGGGSHTQEQNQFKAYLSEMADTLSAPFFGAEVHSFYKQTNEPISINLSDEIQDLINSGVSIMNFFGHAGGSGFDQNIDNPNNFDWNGRFPLLIGNACYTGDIHTPSSNSTSEDFLLIPDKGVIGFLSTVKLGFPITLHLYSRELYRQIATANYGGTIGDHIKRTIPMVEGDGNNLLRVNQVLGMTLHGDPAIVINSFDKPDFKIEETGVFFEPDEVTTQMDSLTIHIVLSNVGKSTNDPFQVIVEREFPDAGADSVYVIHVDYLHNNDTLSLTLPVQPDRAMGENFFSVHIDLPVNEVAELDDYSNNSVHNVPMLITNGGIIPVYPYRFAVVGQNNVTLQASTGDPFAGPTNYRFQVDTTGHFNSPFLAEMIVNQAGGLVQWPLPFTLSDSTVYFWRVAIDEGDELSWRNSSFQYIADKTGWGQAHFHQFKDNHYNQVVYNEPERRFDFFSGTVNLRYNNMGSSVSLAQEIALNLDIVEYGGCGGEPSVHVAVIDPQTFEYWGTSFAGENPEFNFGNHNNGSTCRNRVEHYFIFRQANATQMSGFSNMVLNAVPDGHYVLIYSWRYLVKTHLEQSSFYTTMSQLGASIDPLSLDSIPYTILLRKGESEPIAELIGTSPTDVLALNVNLEASGHNGSMVALPAGPVESWESFHYRFKPRETPTDDSLTVQLIGQQWSNSQLLLPGTQTTSFSHDNFNLGLQVDATQYPFLRIRSRLKDEVDETPPQLRRWHLLYDEIPEAVVNPAAHFEFNSTSADQGEQVEVSYAITNASTRDMDSLLVRYWVVKAGNTIHEIDFRKIAPLPAGETIIDSIAFGTWGLGGANRFWLEVNPVNPETGLYDQLEQYHFNNFLQVGFDVNVDNENPLLDVTFDGLHILDGEIVSANPEISISLTDENLFLMLDQDADTANFEVYFAEPGGEFARHYFYNGATQNMMWIPASGNTNKFQIIYRPEFDKDGTYTMLVRGKDKSGNASGDNDYRINFEVVTQSTITDVLNYPNPFSTKTHFVFTLTGSQVPDYMKIQIMTITGKIVREITHMELGPIRVGRNITDFYWDGRDMYGDRLANGIYLYRVIAKINGENINKRETAAGKYFRQEFGKMYLMR